MPETKPTNLDNLDFDGPGLRVQFDDTRCIVTLDSVVVEQLSENSGDLLTHQVLEMSDDVRACASFYQAAPELWRLLGYTVEESDGLIVVQAPSLDRLNMIRKTTLHGTGVNTGTFIMINEDYIDPVIGAAHLAKREILAASRPTHLLHDNLLHPLGYALMSERIFNRLVEGAQQAVTTGNSELAAGVMSAVDNLGADIIHGEGMMLEVEYAKFLRPSIVSAVSTGDREDQRLVIDRVSRLPQFTINT